MLFPRPRQVIETGPGPGPGAFAVRAQLDASLPAEGFALDIGPHGVAISHRDDRGLRYAHATLDQLVAEHPAGLPGLSIRDWPDFPVRGYMLDVSRDRVPDARDARAARRRLRAGAHQPLRALHRAHVRVRRPRGRVARRLADDGRRHPLARRHVRGRRHRAGGEPELLRPHGSLARARAVPELGGGARRLRAHPRVPAWRRRCSRRLPENAAFAQTLFAELLPNFTSARVNVNCDETFDLGHGVSKELVARGRQGTRVRRPPAAHRGTARRARARGALLGRHRAQAPRVRARSYRVARCPSAGRTRLRTRSTMPRPISTRPCARCSTSSASTSRPPRAST